MEVPSLECPICAKSFLNLTILAEHVDSHYEVSCPEKKTTNTEDLSKILDCPVCLKRGFSTEIELSIHIDSHYSNSHSAFQSDVPSFSQPKEVLHEHVKLFQTWQHAKSTLGRKRENKAKMELTGRIERVEGANEEVKEDSANKLKLDNEFEAQSIEKMENAVSCGQMSLLDYYGKKRDMKIAAQQICDDLSSMTSDILPKIKQTSLECRNIKSVWLCNYIEHFASNFWDQGWGCGYRNIQMILSNLLKSRKYSNNLTELNNEIPSITRIQSLIEKAWNLGYDTQGCEQLGGKLVGTRKWIGATEVVTLFSYFKIKCDLIDFTEATGVNGTHPELIKTCYEYFCRNNNDDSEQSAAPLYLQHQGHSRTVIGVEELESGFHQLLLFDPGTNADTMNLLKNNTKDRIRFLRGSLNYLKHEQYQIVAVTALLSSQQEIEESKILKSKRVAK